MLAATKSGSCSEAFANNDARLQHAPEVCVRDDQPELVEKGLTLARHVEVVRDVLLQHTLQVRHLNDVHDLVEVQPIVDDPVALDAQHAQAAGAQKLGAEGADVADVDGPAAEAHKRAWQSGVGGRQRGCQGRPPPLIAEIPPLAASLADGREIAVIIILVIDGLPLGRYAEIVVDVLAQGVLHLAAMHHAIELVQVKPLVDSPVELHTQGLPNWPRRRQRGIGD
mmetsp:Transcript_149804/g.481162  ORF Transcript_149804/g.481162 Transcript_149804/m.481162 type:complete len:225 (+) Transcript_149804:82-756(+)